jgi:hypothetical protein
MKINIILLCILIFLILIYLNNTNTKNGSREGLTVTNPLEYKLTDENITKIYKEYCNKFGLPGGLELNDARRKLSLTELINDAKSFVNDPNSVNLCYTTPSATTTVLTDDLRTKVYGVFCDKPITLTDARKALTFDQLWADASYLATINSPECFINVINPNGLTDTQITSIYSGYCDKFGLPGGLQINSKMRNQPINEAIGDAKFYASDFLSKDLCYKIPPIILTDEIKQKIWSGYCQAPLPEKEPISDLTDLFTKAVSYSQVNKYCLSPITNPMTNTTNTITITTINSDNIKKLLKSIFRINFSNGLRQRSNDSSVWASNQGDGDLWMLKKQPTAMGGYRFYNLLSKMSLAVGTDGPYMWIDLPNENNFTFDIKNSPTGIKIINRVSNKMLYSSSVATPNSVVNIPISTIISTDVTNDAKYDVSFYITYDSHDLYYLLNYPFKLKHKATGRYVCHNPTTKILEQMGSSTANCYVTMKYQPVPGYYRFVFNSSNLAIYIDTDKSVKLDVDSNDPKFSFMILNNKDSNKLYNIKSASNLYLNNDYDIKGALNGEVLNEDSLSFFFEF